MASLWVTSPDGNLIPLETSGYANEKDFQQLLADNPAVLASAIDEGDASTWLLIDRELPIKAGETEAGTWTLDHLFISADGRPVLVEVKRSSDPRARREVVAQMLDYAASFAIDWSADQLRVRRERRFIHGGAASKHAEMQAEMESFLTATATDEDQLWADVQSNIDAGRIRLLFVADKLSETLVRVIEYLNAQLSSAEVLGIEVRRHAPALSAAPVAYQPVVRGRSSLAAQRKSSARGHSREVFDRFVVEHLDVKTLESINVLLEHVVRLGGFPSMGTSERSPTLYVNFPMGEGGAPYWPLLLIPRQDKLVVRMRKMRTHPAFADEGDRDALLARVAGAVNSVAQGNPAGAPWVPLSALNEAGVVDKLTEVLAWVIGLAQASHPTDTPK